MAYGFDDFSAVPTGANADSSGSTPGFSGFSVPAAGTSPATAPAVPMGSTGYRDAGAAGVGLQAGGELGAGVAAFYAGRANRAVADFDARIDGFKAIAATNRGIFEQNQIGRRTGQVIGQQRTAQAANGMTIGSGTGATVAAQEEGIGMGDQAQARTNALMEAWGFRSQAGADAMRGRLAASAGRQALIGSAIGAAGVGTESFYRLSN